MKKILIVEDEISLLNLLVEKFESEGFEVIVARDGKEGLEQAESTKPDLILLDIIMPVLDGMSMLNTLRKKDWGKDIPVIMLTNLSDDEKIKESLEKGVFEYLIKADWELNDVIAKVKDKLGL